MKQTEYIVLKLPKRETRKKIRKAVKIIDDAFGITFFVSFVAAIYNWGMLALNVIFKLDKYVPDNALINGIVFAVIALVTYHIAAYLFTLLSETKGE